MILVLEDERELVLSGKFVVAKGSCPGFFVQENSHRGYVLAVDVKEAAAE